MAASAALPTQSVSGGDADSYRRGVLLSPAEQTVATKGEQA